MRRSVICLQDCMTLTPRGIRGVLPARMRLVSSWRMVRRSCAIWCICLAIGHWRDPDAHNGKVIQTATHLTWILAEYLADTIAWLMRSILDNASKILFDNDTEPLLTPGFWILPLYRELLNSARRNRPSAASERARGCTGLVKLICKENKEQRGKRKFHEGEPHPNDRGGFTQWFGSCSMINTLYVWFPASWAPMVAERLFWLVVEWDYLSSTWAACFRAFPAAVWCTSLAPIQTRGS